MTDDMMNLQALVGKTADSDFLREMIGFAAQRLMSLEVGGLTGAGLWYALCRWPARDLAERRFFPPLQQSKGAK